jgi:hypothetical protein
MRDIPPLTQEDIEEVVAYLGGVPNWDLRLGTPSNPPLPQPAPVGQKGRMDTTALRQEREDRAREIIETEAESTLAILYQALYAMGLRIGTIQQDIKRALEKEEGGAG